MTPLSRTHLAVAAAAAAIVVLSACGPAGADPSPAASAPAAVPTGTVPPTTASPSPTTPPPTTPAVAVSRPANGAVVVRPSPRGKGTLELRNGNDQDAYVTLARGGRADLAVYVRAGENTRVKGVPDGSYAVYYVTGGGWAPTLRRFTGGEDGQRFSERLDYRTTSTSSTIWTLTLNPVPGGTARTDPVDAAGIPR